jgi:Carboxypeptidase regulatory-like domain/TonB-dependent Receptor Plug Domain
VKIERFFPLLIILICLSVGLARAQSGASLHGAVILPAGAPVAQASVTVEGSGGGQAATTNQAGQYTIRGLNPGTYKITIAAPGYDPFEVSVTLTSSSNEEVDAVLMSTPKIQVETPAETPAETPTPAAGSQAGETKPAPSSPQTQQTVATQGLSVKAEKGKGALYGIVTDPSGAVIPGGTATAAGKAGPVTANANAAGQYVINGLAPGAYKLTVAATGFAPFVTDITVAADQALELDAALQPPSSKTEVNVEASNAAAVETESAHIEGTITQKEVEKIGLNGRNFSQLIALAPGVSNQTGQDEAKVGVAGSVKYSVNGGRVEYNNFDVDGSDVLNAGLNGAESTLMVYPSLDAIQEVKVLTSNYGAMYGRTASGTVLVTTKSGTPKFHGNLYDFVRDEAFNARNYFDPPGKPPLYRRQDFGGTIGGPIIKDKAFFFWSEEFRLEKSPLGPGGEPGDFNQAVPTLQERGIGVNDPNCPAGATCADFSDVCPVATASFNRGQYPDCPAPNGTVQTIIPIDYNSQAILNSGLIPLPNSATGCNSTLANTSNPITGQPNMPCYVAVISPATYWREELGRFDYNFTQSTRLSFRYIHDSWNTTVPTPLWGYVQNSFPTVQNKFDGPGTSMVVRLSQTITPSLVNEFVASYVNSHITLSDVGAQGGVIQPPQNGMCDPAGDACIKVGSIFKNGFGGKPPGLVIAGTNGQYGGNGFAADPSYMPWEHTNPTYSLADNISKAIGKHTLQFGIQIADSQRSESNGAIGAATGDLQGILTFSNQNNPGTSGNTFADFLRGANVPGAAPSNTPNTIQSYQQDSAQLRYHNNYWIYEPYVQDDWRVSRHLTLNLGVRFSLFQQFHEKNLNAYNWELSAFNQTLAATAQIAPPSPVTGFQGGYLEVNGQPLVINPANPGAALANSVVTNGLVRCGVNGVPASCMSGHLFNPAPRIGFAWDPKGDGRTSIRAGYGMFFEHGTPKEANTGSLEGSAPLNFTMTNPYPGNYSNIGMDPNGDQVAYPLDVTSIPTKTVWPYVQQWSLSVQRQLPKDMVATIAYVGSKGTHLSAELQLNQLPLAPTGPNTGIFATGNPFGPGQPITSSDCQSYTGGLNSAGTGFVPGNFTVGNTTVFPQDPAWTNLVAACYGDFAHIQSPTPPPNALRTFAPGFQRVLSLQNIADSQYHALQTTIRRTRGPLTVGASYTYSHSFDDSSDRSTANFVNSADIKSSWASSDFDQRHLFNFSYVYDLPKISGFMERASSFKATESNADISDAQPSPAPATSTSHVLRQALDGWQISGVTVFQSGTPFSVLNGGSSAGISVLDNAGVANGAGIGSYPDVIGNPRSHIQPGINNTQSVGPLLLNPAAFAAPQGLTFGNAGRNFLNNPHRLNFDLSLLKTFKITENSNLEFRAETFNIFNHTQFRIFNPNIGNTAKNTISCYGGPNYSALGGLTTLTNQAGSQAVNIDCTTGGSFLRPVDSHRPRTLQFGLKYSF